MKKPILVSALIVALFIFTIEANTGCAAFSAPWCEDEESVEYENYKLAFVEITCWAIANCVFQDTVEDYDEFMAWCLEEFMDVCEFTDPCVDQECIELLSEPEELSCEGLMVDDDACFNVMFCGDS
jgi:hypothetical protein